MLPSEVTFVKPLKVEVYDHMNFGLGLPARHPSLLAGHARAAEAAGFSHLWIYDSPRFAESYVAMTHCAMVAPRLIVGTAVTNTETRDPTVTANALATLSLLTGGRVVVGIGLGDSAVKYLGRAPARFEAFREKVMLIRALLRGERVAYNGKTLELPAPPQTAPPLLISADRPKTFEAEVLAKDRRYSRFRKTRSGVAYTASKHSMCSAAASASSCRACQG